MLNTATVNTCIRLEIISWLKSKREQFIMSAFMLLPIIIIIYYPIYQYLSAQEVKVTINISEMTVFYIIFLFYMAYFADKMLTKYTKTRLQRYTGLFLFTLGLLFLLDAIGMTMRWE